MVELIAIRYGSAIFELAKEKDAVALLKEEVLAIQDSFLDEDLKEILSHPKVSDADKKGLLEDALTGKISHDLLGLLVLIIEKGRQEFMPVILEKVLELIDEHDGKVKAYIISATTLSEEQQTTIVLELQKQLSKDVVPLYEVDESLIGGIVIRIGDRIVDNSIKGHLHTLSRELLETKINIT